MRVYDKKKEKIMAWGYINYSVTKICTLDCHFHRIWLLNSWNCGCVLSVDEAVKCKKSLFKFALNRALRSFRKIAKTTFSLVISASLCVRPSIYRFAWNSLAPTGRFFMKYYIGRNF